MSAVVIGVLRDFSPEPQDSIYFFVWGQHVLGDREMSAMRWQFDNCSLDVERRELRRAGAVVAVEPQVFDLLVHLIRNREHVVSKDNLIKWVWQGRIVSDSALGQSYKCCANSRRR